MARALREVRDEALQLSPQDRLQLAQELNDSVLTPAQREIEEEWLDEADRRRETWAAERDVTKPAEEVFARLRDKYGSDSDRASRRR